MNEPKPVGESQALDSEIKPLRPVGRFHFSIAQILGGTAIVAILAGAFRTAPLLWFGLWIVSTVVATILTAPLVVFGRAKVHWYFLESLAFVLPFAVWCTLVGWDDKGKSLSNMIEPILISVAIPLAAGVRLIIGRRLSEPIVASALIVFLCVLAMTIYFAVPALPE